MTDQINYWIDRISLATMAGSNDADRLGIVGDAAVVVDQGRIVWCGPRSQLPSTWIENRPHLDGRNRWLTPGLIDCHTHLVFGGNRIDDWRLRMEGVSYQEIAQRGGGILSTVQATRGTSVDELEQQAAARLNEMQAHGVMGIEIKSGYGLDLATEQKMLTVISRLRQRYDLPIQATFLAAHALPPEFAGRRQDYIDVVTQQWMPQLSDQYDAVDVFCESIAFDVAQTKQVLAEGRRLEKHLKVHAEQLSLMGGAQVAAELGARSADHLEYLDEAGVAAMSDMGTVATLLPGAFYFLRERQMPPIDLLRRYQVPMAVATDFNPGSSPLGSLPLAGNLAITLFDLTPSEALLGMTRYAAQALGWERDLGTIEVGKRARLVLWDCDQVEAIVYGIGVPIPVTLMGDRQMPQLPTR